MQVTTRGFLTYTFMPRLLPRLRELFSVSFSHFSYFVALIFEAVRLLPSGHPYLNPAYFGHYSVGQVIREAYKRLKFDYQHLDQIFIFFTVTLGILLFFVQLIVITVTFLMPAAFAATTLVEPYTLNQEIADTFTLSSIIETRFPCKDIAFMLLDRVFGVEDMFGSKYNDFGNKCAAGVASTTSFPYPYHYGLQTLFMTFSVAMMAVALLVLTYFVITIFAEMVRDGTPFGKRFNRVWAPIRLVMAFGMLVPLSNGLNAAQYVVLIAAKWGSGFATNGLTYYYGEIRAGRGTTPFGDPKTLIAMPNAPDPSSLLQFMLTARTCQYAVQFKEEYDDDTNTVKTPINGWYLHISTDIADPNMASDALVGFGQNDKAAPAATVAAALPFAFFIKRTGFENFNIIFGHKDTTEVKYPREEGGVRPYCGKVTMTVVGSDKNQMTLDLQERYLRILSAMWKDPEVIEAAAKIASYHMNNDDPCAVAGGYPTCAPVGDQIPNLTDLKANKVKEYKGYLTTAIKDILTKYTNGDYNASIDWCGPDDDPWLLSYGWAGAAICYNKIAQYNGDFTAAARALPVPRTWPIVLEWVQQKRQEQQQNITTLDRFNPTLTGDNDEKDIFEGTLDQRIVAEASYKAYSLWVESGVGSGEGGTPDLTGVGIKDIINMIFGTDGIFNMSKTENRDIHPLALLASAGRGLIESAIFNIGVAGLGLGVAIATPLGSLGTILGSFMLTAATISISAGFVLFYIIPLMPFMYFFFAVSVWLKSIFEAMVGVPLWALAHLRIDGDGIPGQAAMGGYLLILEIFLRPILIVFGLLASSFIFVASVKVLNELWTTVVDNLTGFDGPAADKTNPLEIDTWRGPIDEFFYTVIYVIIVYMLALSCFKLVDLIPNYILRWIGQSVETFASGEEDYSSQMSQKATFGFSAASSKVIGGVGDFGDQISQNSQGYRKAAKAAKAADAAKAAAGGGS